ncbi:hypothetical protein NA78x_000932 [Anatilimnocola sp. NA78]|uniref:hypothetical protein n=1 Tax=Anatilimnocola sp. NA78 TaxID=3415683 RepID=UPI003CE4D153
MHRVWYEFSGDGRLPAEITQYTMLEDRLAALDELRVSRSMIRAEYDNFKSLIIECERAAHAGNTEVAENPGIPILLTYIRVGGLPPVTAWALIANYAVPSNVDHMLSLLDGRCLEFVRANVECYPADESGWQQLEQKYRHSEANRQNLVPYRSPLEMVARDRALAMLLRSALAKLDR